METNRVMSGGEVNVKCKISNYLQKKKKKKQRQEGTGYITYILLWLHKPLFLTKGFQYTTEIYDQDLQCDEIPLLIVFWYSWKHMLTLNKQKEEALSSTKLSKENVYSGCVIFNAGLTGKCVWVHWMPFKTMLLHSFFTRCFPVKHISVSDSSNIPIY
jgi:hypothetical protein